MELIWDRQFGFLKETLVAPVSRLKIILGKTLGGATIATLQGIIVLVLTFMLGFRPVNWLLLPIALVVMFLIALLYTALGTAIASTMDDFHGFQLIMNFLVMPTFFLSGALFPLDSAPRAIKIISLFNPLSYGVDALRQLLTGVAVFNFATDIFVLIVLSFFLLFFAAKLFERIQA